MKPLPNRMERVTEPRTSVCVQSIGHNRETHELYVRFKGKHGSRLYVYFGVPRVVFLQMRRATSKGRFVHRRIKDQYGYARVTASGRRLGENWRAIYGLKSKKKV